MLNLKIIFDIIINFLYTTLIKIYWRITVKTAEFQTKNVPAINKVLTVLKALNTGATLTLGKDVVKLAETNNDGIMLMLKLDPAQDHWIGFDVSLIEFSEMCAQLTDDEIAIMQANIALNMVAKRQ